MLSVHYVPPERFDKTKEIDQRSDIYSLGLVLYEEIKQDGASAFRPLEEAIRQAKKDASAAGKLLAGKTMNQVNQIAVDAVIAAHESAGVPVIRIDIPQLTAYYMGQLVYYFETTCAITATLMGVNPFDQPGVEAYKAEMRRLLASE